MTTTLPDLSTWHRVPLGATIPAGTPYAYVVYGDSLAVELDGSPCDKQAGVNAHYTEHPIAPRCRPRRGRRSWCPATSGPRTSS